MKKITKLTCFIGLKLLVFSVVGCAVLLLLNVFGVMQPQAQSWYLLLLVIAAVLIQWAVLILVLYLRSDEEGTYCEMDAGTWSLTFLPIAALVFAFIVMYVSLHSTVSFFALDFTDFLVMFAVFAAVFVFCYLLSYAYRLATNGKRDSGVRFGREKRSEKEREQEILDAQEQEKEEKGDGIVFPDLLEMDREFLHHPYTPSPSSQVTLRKLCDGFNMYLESKGMFYKIDTLRSFVAGLACSHFLILEGLSGTGKTSLPKYFAEYIGCNICFTSVQASWKDRGDILGYYNDFTAKFRETPFLRALYRANYETDEINLMVLDEMNLSRVEYYFADFLSVLELDTKNWKIELMPVSTGGVLPEKLEECSVRIPQSVWFIGTANKDDSTFTITDKVYDRAIVIDFSSRSESVTSSRNLPTLHIGQNKLCSLFEEAWLTPSYALSREMRDRFATVTQFVLDAFDVNFGNRILNQIVRFVPVYVACGGTAAKALDIMFSRKILRKLEGRFEDGLKGNLVKLEKLILSEFDKADFSDTLQTIARLKRKLL